MPNIKTPEAILSYVTLFTPRAASEDADPTYSCSFVFPEGTDVKPLQKAALAVAQEKWGSKLQGAQIQVLDTQFGKANFLVAGDLRIRLPWRNDADDVAAKGYPDGAVFINTRNANAPGVVSTFPDPSNENKPAVIVNDVGDLRYRDGTVMAGVRPVYSGVIGIGLLSVFDYDKKGNKGVSFGLQGVQILRDGDRLDGRARAEDEFDADMDSAPNLDDLMPEEAEAVAETAGGGGADLSDLLG